MHYHRKMNPRKDQIQRCYAVQIRKTFKILTVNLASQSIPPFRYTKLPRFFTAIAANIQPILPMPTIKLINLLNGDILMCDKPGVKVTF